MLEYAASVWDPHHTSDTNKLEQVQRRAARFVCNNYSPYSSVTQMLSDLGWQQLKDRRKHIRLALFYKIVHHLIAVPHEDILRKADSRTRSSHNYKYRTLRSYKDPYRISFFSPDYTGMESPASGHSAFRTPLIFLKTGSIRHRHSARPPPALSWPPAFSWPRPAFRQPHLGSILPHGGLPSIRQVKSSQVKGLGWGGVVGRLRGIRNRAAFFKALGKNIDFTPFLQGVGEKYKFQTPFLEILRRQVNFRPFFRQDIDFRHTLLFQRPSTLE